MFPTSYLRFVERAEVSPMELMGAGKIKILQQWWTEGLKENNQPYPPNSTFGKWVDVSLEAE